MEEMTHYADYMVEKYSNDRYISSIATAKAQFILGVSTCIMHHKCNASIKDRMQVSELANTKLKSIYQI